MMDFYLTNEEERNKIIDNAFNLVSNKYTWKHMAENLLSEIRNSKDLK